MTLLAPGTCRHCACSEERPCGYCRGVHGGVAWQTRERLVCASPGCIRAENARVRQAQRERPRSEYARAYGELASRGWGHGAITEELRKRRASRRKGRAA